MDKKIQVSKSEKSPEERSLKFIEYCILAYKLYSDSTQYASDPFYDGYVSRDKVQDIIKGQAKPLGQPYEPDLDYISFDRSYKQVNPRHPAFTEIPKKAGFISNLQNSQKE
jgi:hypothetical protein